MASAATVTVPAAIAATSIIDIFVRDAGYRSVSIWRARPVDGRVTITVETRDDSAQKIADEIAAAYS